jgi:hypothetical protein
MTTAPNGKQQASFAREIDGVAYILYILAAGDQRRPLVVHAVPDLPCTVVIRVPRQHHRSGHGVAQLFDGGFFELDLGAIQ